MSGKGSVTKTAFARSAGISRSQLYYRHRLPEKDWTLKQKIEEVLRRHPSYGSRRISLELQMNGKKVKRVMSIFGIRPHRRRGRKFRKPKDNSVSFPNLLLTEFPRYPHHIWASDFTHVSFHGKVIYLATVPDLFTREIVGFSVTMTHSVSLVVNAFKRFIRTTIHESTPY